MEAKTIWVAIIVGILMMMMNIFATDAGNPEQEMCYGSCVDLCPARSAIFECPVPCIINCYLAKNVAVTDTIYNCSRGCYLQKCGDLKNDPEKLLRCMKDCIVNFCSIKTV